MNDDIVKRLEIKAGVMEMGEKIAWGSDTALMREAAEEITRLREDVSKWKSLAEANAKLVDVSQGREDRQNRIDAMTDNCQCHKCLKGKVDEHGFPLEFKQMILCPICHNKRCPKANDHNNECSGSNDVGQVGSYY